MVSHTRPSVSVASDNKSPGKWRKTTLIYAVTLNVSFRFVQCTRQNWVSFEEITTKHLSVLLLYLSDILIYANISEELGH